MIQDKLLMGAHVSIAGGFDKAIERGEKIGATCIQIFTKSNRQWGAKKITSDDVDAFLDAQKKSSIKMVVAHASYLINLCSDNNAIIRKSIDALIEELQRCEQLDIPYLVLHPGTSSNPDTQKVLITVADHINQAFKEVKPKNTTLLLETMAGQGSTIGKTVEELAVILDHVHDKKHIGVCIDTCHIFAAGYDLSTKKFYDDFWNKISKLIGIKNVKAFHINDSKKDFDSHVDRHEHVGKGKINPVVFKMLLKDKRFSKIPKILETPKEDEFKDDVRNLKTLRDYFNS
ncbi:deoxyribonuclease IV [Candidatus Babeliales bacterium]|nr:deoxyribonuclease IV [Candidatus Babeliales bacterium]